MKKLTKIIVLGLSALTLTACSNSEDVQQQAEQEYATSQSSFSYSEEASKQQQEEVKTQSAIEEKYENDNADETTHNLQLIRSLEKQGYTYSEASRGLEVQSCVQKAMTQGFTDFYTENHSINSTLTRRIDNGDTFSKVDFTYYKDDIVIVFISAN